MKVVRGKRSNKYCGPAALSLITGKHVDECVKEVHDHRDHYGFLKGYRRRSVRGMTITETLRILIRMGYEVVSLGGKGPTDDTGFDRKPPTLVGFVRWLKRHTEWNPENVYLVNVTGHYLVMKGIKLFDNRNPEGVFFGRYDRRRRRVRHAWLVSPRKSRPVPSGSSRRPAASS